MLVGKLVSETSASQHRIFAVFETTPVIMTIILINQFSVPTDLEESFLESWREVAEYMSRRPGYISTELHRGLDIPPSPDGIRLWVNRAEWESAQSWQDTCGTEEFRRLVQSFPVAGSPHLYEVYYSHHLS